jgi:hypothetical protein
MPLSFRGIGNAAEFVGQVFNLRPISIGLPVSVQEPPWRVTNPPQVENLPHKYRGIPHAGKPSGIAHECVRHSGARLFRSL